MLASTTILLPALFLFATVQDQAKPAAPDRFVLEAGEHDLLQVIDASARFLGRNYLLAPGEVGGNKPVVTLQKKLELDAAGCEAVVSQLAYVHGLVATPLDRERGVWEWINTHGAKRGELSTRATVVTPDQARKLQQVKVFVTTTVALQHANPNIIA